MSSSSCVKVGVRIRPKLGHEKGRSCLEEYDAQSISIRGQTFTYDYAFGPQMSQTELYSSTAGPMLNQFMQGYNVTIMAYGQTGSGKTYTMGTSDASAIEGEDAQGLIPRFVHDLFANLQTIDCESKVCCSFLEIYGEDVFDLLQNDASTLVATGPGTLSRPSMPVRENDQGSVFVQGLQEINVDSADAALALLYEGTQNRTTASTAMNAGSSRSHAVFTVTLEQTVKQKTATIDMDEEVDVGLATREHEVATTTCSKLTFVDLAGSERVKKTGAEGQRMKEGIQINSGLFNLGQVINGLADDQRLKHSKQQVAKYIPYRNSKLTHLLKDALGGNSQTLFLACVSPAESNEGETFSTLSYAKTTRNIQNKPVRNMDQSMLELARLKYAVKLWMTKAVNSMFAGKEGSGMSSSPGTPSESAVNTNDTTPRRSSALGADILARPEVLEYIDRVNSEIMSKVEGGTLPISRKVRLSICSPPPLRVPRRGLDTSILSSAVGAGSRTVGGIPRTPGAASQRSNRRTNAAFALAAAVESYQEEGGDGDDLPSPEETEALVARMLEMVEKEKIHRKRATGDVEADAEVDSDGDAEDNDNDAASHTTQEVDAEIEEKEGILAKLMDTVKGYAAVKVDYEKLLGTIGGLEIERKQLERELERAKKLGESQPTGGAAAEKARLQTERIKERFTRVRDELDRMKAERKKKESSYRAMQRESRKCDELGRELARLKEAKNSLVRQSKQATARHAKAVKEMNHKVAQHKKMDVKKQRQMNALKSDVSKKERILAHRDKEISRMQAKLKACEEHVQQLLKVQSQSRRAIKSSGITGGKSGTGAEAAEHSSDESYASAKKLLDSLIKDSVARRHTSLALETKHAALTEANGNMMRETEELERLLATRSDLSNEMAEAEAAIAEAEAAEPCTEAEEALMAAQQHQQDVAHEISEVERDIAATEDAIDHLSREVDLLSAETAELGMLMGTTKESEEGTYLCDLGKNILSNLGTSSTTQLALTLTERLVDLEVAHMGLKDNLKCAEREREKAEARVCVLEADMTAAQNTFETKLAESDRVRMNEVWAVIAAKDERAARESTNGDGNAEPREDTVSTLFANAENVALSTALARAAELDRLCDDISADREAVQAMLVDKEDEVASLERRLAELDNRHRLGVDDDVQSACGSSTVFDTLTELWDRLGAVSVADRTQVVSCIEEARAVACSSAIKRAREALRTAEEQEEMLRKACVAAGRVLGGSTQAHLQCCLTDLESANGKRKSSNTDLDAHEGNTFDEAGSNGDNDGEDAGRPAEQDQPARDSVLSGCERPVAERLSLLEQATTGALDDFKMRVSRLAAHQVTLKGLVQEMRLGESDLDAALASVLKVDLSAAFTMSTTSHHGDRQQNEQEKHETRRFSLDATSIVAVAEQVLATKVGLLDANLDELEIKIKQLNVQRAATASKAVQERDAILVLMNHLEMQHYEEAEPIVSSSGGSGGSGRSRNPFGECNSDTGDEGDRRSDLNGLALGDDLPADTMQAAFKLVATGAAAGTARSNPPGSTVVLLCLERLRLSLETVKMNRETVSDLVCTIATVVGRITTPHFATVTDHDAFASDNASRSVARAAVIQRFAEAQKRLKNSQSAVQTLEDTLADTIRSSAPDAGTQVQTLDMADGADWGEEEGQLITQLTAALEELAGLVLFVDEAWLEAAISGMEGVWDSSVGYIERAAFLRSELRNASALSDACREMHRLDTILVKHVEEMESFEERSRFNRKNVLKGSSKLLMEEENYRKKGKRKYEMLMEKMSAAMAVVREVLMRQAKTEAGQSECDDKIPGNSSSGTEEDVTERCAVGGVSLLMGFQGEIGPDMAALGLSTAARDLLKGKTQERSELMHLHTTTHGTKRWDGEEAHIAVTTTGIAPNKLGAAERARRIQQERNDSSKPPSGPSRVPRPMTGVGAGGGGAQRVGKEKGVQRKVPGKIQGKAARKPANTNPFGDLTNSGITDLESF